MSSKQAATKKGFIWESLNIYMVTSLLASMKDGFWRIYVGC
jgi:hypothetical protein